MMRPASILFLYIIKVGTLWISRLSYSPTGDNFALSTPIMVTFIGVDNAKLSPVGEYDKLDIQRVPTFIIYKNNIEAGRIIENPTTSLEQDMVNILTRNE